MTELRFPRVAALKSADMFRQHLAASGIELDFDATLAPPGESPLGRPLEAGRMRAGNRF